MKSKAYSQLQDIKRDALTKGLELKLQELNDQRERILQLLEGMRPKEVNKKPHWTQMPENKARLRKMRRKAAKNR